MIRAAFFDIDGTLCAPHTPHLPAVTLEALQAMRDQGIKLAIVTGRNLQETVPVDNDFLFDGISVCNGGLNYVGAPGSFTLIGTNALPASIVSDVAKLVEEGRLATLVDYQDYSAVAGERPMIQSVAEFALEQDRYRYERNLMPDAPVYKFGFIFDGQEDRAAARAIENLSLMQNDVIVHDACGVGQGKQLGLAALAQAWGIPIEDTIAFGDGLNDIDFLQSAGTGVAVGGAKPEVVAAADIATNGYWGEGFFEAFERLGQPLR